MGAVSKTRRSVVRNLLELGTLSLDYWLVVVKILRPGAKSLEPVARLDGSWVANGFSKIIFLAGFW